MGEKVVLVTLQPFAGEQEGEGEGGEEEEVYVLSSCVSRLPSDVLERLDGTGEEVGGCVHSPLEDLYSSFVFFLFFICFVLLCLLLFYFVFPTFFLTFFFF